MRNAFKNKLEGYDSFDNMALYDRCSSFWGMQPAPHSSHSGCITQLKMSQSCLLYCFLFFSRRFYNRSLFDNLSLNFISRACLSFCFQVKIWFQNHRYKCKRQAKEKAMAEQNAQNQVSFHIWRRCEMPLCKISRNYYPINNLLTLFSIK